VLEAKRSGLDAVPRLAVRNHALAARDSALLALQAVLHDHHLRLTRIVERRTRGRRYRRSVDGGVLGVGQAGARRVGLAAAVR
jgi:hypothetical protein